MYRDKGAKTEEVGGIMNKGQFLNSKNRAVFALTYLGIKIIFSQNMISQFSGDLNPAGIPDPPTSCFCLSSCYPVMWGDCIQVDLRISGRP